MKNQQQAISEKLDNSKQIFEKVIAPVINLLVSLGLLAAVLYLIFGGQFNINDLADANGTVRIPVVLLIVLIPLGYLYDFLGETAATVVIIGLLLVWVGASVWTLYKRIKEIRASKTK